MKKAHVVKSPPLAFIASRSEHAAIKAIAQGAATDYQQKLFFDWICRGVGSLTHVPGDPYTSAFNEGRRFLPCAVIHFTSLPITTKGDQND